MRSHGSLHAISTEFSALNMHNGRSLVALTITFFSYEGMKGLVFFLHPNIEQQIAERRLDREKTDYHRKWNLVELRCLRFILAVLRILIASNVISMCL